MRLLCFAVAILLLTLVSPMVGPAAAQPPGAGLSIHAISPTPNSTITSTTPTIAAGFTDSAGTVLPGSVSMFIGDENVTGADGFVVSSSGASYPIPPVLALKAGNQTITVEASDTVGNFVVYYWNFTVNPNATSSAALSLPSVNPIEIVIIVGLVAAICGATFGGYILYLRQTTRFTFRKYFATHPVKSNVYVVYIPAAAAFVFVVIGLLYVLSTPGLPWAAPYYVLIGAIFIGLTAFGIDSRREMQRIRAYERAFAQFLFEMADALRGGLDPAKSVVELSKTTSSIMQKQLRIAADGIQVGRPFDLVIRNLAAPMNSSLIRRYAALIADASTIGGEISIVVYRAAKDMDDFVKIEDEREKELMLPVAVIYIAFGVLMAVLLALLYVAPLLGTLNINVVGAGNLFSATSISGQVPRLTTLTLEQRFFELMLINALGTGAIIGAFTEGRARYGILHSLALVAATAIVFAIIFP